MKKLGLVSVLILSISILATAQTSANPEKAIKNSPAFGIILLKKAEIDIKISRLSSQFKEAHPDLKQARIEQYIIQRDLERLLTQTNSDKLTAELGRSILQKFEVETKLMKLKGLFTEKHPTIVQLNKELLILNNSLNQILN